MTDITTPRLSDSMEGDTIIGGVRSMSPIITPPPAAILGVGAVPSAPAVLSGELAERRVLTLTPSRDHCILYGVDAAQFPVEVKSLLEQPARLVL
jgi:pyruvate/2-oxoglutarate dehydrogenase complex dihydrolipoamide acyltransferase (E2) component